MSLAAYFSPSHRLRPSRQHRQTHLVRAGRRNFGVGLLELARAEIEQIAGDRGIAEVGRWPLELAD